MSAALIVKPGLLTTVQDLGRWGHQSRGVAVSGPMDPFAHQLANALVGNDRGAATLEITLTGPEIEFDDRRIVAVAGGLFEITLDGEAMPAGRPFVVRERSHLRFGRRIRGARAYLAIEGGLAVAPTLGSRATHLVSRMGGFAGRALAAGDRVPLGPARRARLSTDAAGRAPRPADTNLAGTPARVRVLPGPDRALFASTALDLLESGPYTVSSDSNRMGFRLQGPAIAHEQGADIISDATPMGVLQVPASGQPVLLMADRQTTGGYPRLATVITADLSVAGQLAPGDTVAFSVSHRKEAIAALIAQERVLMAAEDAARS